MKSKLLRFLSILMIGFMFLACENPAGNTDDGSSSKNNSGNNSTSQQQNGGGSKDNNGGTQQGDSGKQSGGGTQQGDSGKQNGGGTQQGDKDKQTDSDDTKTEQNKSEDEEKETQPEVKKNIGVRFNFEGAQALAKLEEKQNGSRAATNVDDLGDLVKIMADGSMENAITVGENCSLSDIVGIYKSPLETSNDVFIVFNSESTIGYEEVEKEYDWGEKYTDKQEIRVGQLICLHENGAIADILKKEDSADYWNSHVSLKTDSVTFDAAGNVYFISSDNGDMIYQYNPATDELTKMVAAVENTYYQKMQIDNEGQWIFVSGSRNSSYFLRAIPIGNPNAFVNIFYSSNYRIDADRWAYDAKNGKMYFIVNDGNKSGLFIATKAGSFRDKKFYHNITGESFNDNIFEAYCGSKTSFYWNDNVKTNGVFDSKKIIQLFIDKVGSVYDCQTGEIKQISLDDVDIRFDKLAYAKGGLKVLAILTAGKKNEEAFDALNNRIGMDVLYSLSGKDDADRNWYEWVNGKGYRHYLLADILYLKDTDILLVDSDKELFEYAAGFAYDESGNLIFDENGDYSYVIKSVKGADLLGRQSDGFYSNSFENNYLYYDYDNGWQESVNSFSFTPSFYEQDNSSSVINSADLSEEYYFYFPLNAKAVLDYLFGYCNIEGVKEFRLTSFKNDEKYSSLYSTLTNEQAIEWLANDAERFSLFGEVAGLFRVYKDGDYVPSLSYSSFMNMLSKTCFIAGTNNKAITWNWDCNFDNSIPYISEYYVEGAKLTATDTGIYYEYYNTSGTDPYYYIVQVADADGELVELVNKLPLPAGKVVQSEKNKDRILLQYSVMDENGAELGYHHIYSVEMANGKVTNCFDNVPNRNNLEVVSFNSAGDLLYYSAVRGTSVENGIVNIVTNEYNPLTVQRKMVAVYTFN